jgi:hypothetical protein
MLLGLLLCVLLGNPASGNPASGDTVSATEEFISIVPIPPSIPEDLIYGKILREIRIEGNRYTREWIIRKAIRSEIGHPYTQSNAKRDVLWVLRLGAFTSVILATEPVDDGIVLVVTVTEATRDRDRGHALHPVAEHPAHPGERLRDRPGRVLEQPAWHLRAGLGLR